MAINKKLVNFKKKEDYTKQKEQGNILDTSIVFIDDSKEIVTHDTVFNCNGGGNADWLAEEGEDGYIKNRPFGETKICIYENTDVTITEQAGNGYGSLNVVFKGMPYDASLEYTVVINDKVYFNLKTDPSNAYLANDYTGYASPLYKNADFVLITANNSMNGSMYFKEPINNGTVIIYAYVVKKIEDKYINKNGIDKISLNGATFSPVDSYGEKIVYLNTISSIDVNGIHYLPSSNGNVDLGTISSDSPFKSGSGLNSAQMSGCTASGNYSHAEGYDSTASGYASHAEGNDSTASGYASHAEGLTTNALGIASHAEGYNVDALNTSEHASGRYNNSVKGSTTFGDSGNTLFTVGNGEYEKIHNAFQIMQNGDIYIPDTNADGEHYEKPMIKLQDALVKLWKGSEEEYNALGSYNDNTIYVII